MSSFEVKRFGDEISSFVLVTITYWVRVSYSFLTLCKNVIVVHSLADKTRGGPIHCNMMTAVVV